MERLWQDKTDQFGGRQKSKYIIFEDYQNVNTHLQKYMCLHAYNTCMTTHVYICK